MLKNNLVKHKKILNNQLIKKPIFIIDFDSTFITVEALDELATIALATNPDREKLLKQIEDITKQGMEGKIDFATSLHKRLSLFSPTKHDIEKVVELFQTKITPSMLRNKAFFTTYAQNIYIISGGFIEYIAPTVKPFGILQSHILANSFTFDRHDKVTGYDIHNPLAQKGGKAKAVASLKLKGDIYVIGDGYTDYEIKQQDYATKFFAFTENINRKTVTEKADAVIHSFDELLYELKLPRATSYPLTKMKILLLENIHPQGINLLQQAGFTVEFVKHALNEDELSDVIGDISVLGIRSKTEVTKKVLARAKKLQAIGAFCIGTNQIDLTTAAEKGIAVFNAPYSNTRSVVELVMGEIIMLSRSIFEKSTKLHEGIWDKSAKGAREIRGKKLGIIGYGNIGTQLSILAESFGMHVYFYDITDKLALGNAYKCDTLEELLKLSDIITVHVDGRKENTNLIGTKEFALMKDGVIFLNISRGFIVNIDALVENITRGKIHGASIDVFPYEPKSNTEPFTSPLQNLPNVILTPHIGGSTEEAQKNIGEFVAHKLISYINTGSTTMSINFPALQLPDHPNANRFIHIHKNVPGILAQITTILANHKANIVGQYLKTNETIGYVITDIAKDHDEKILSELKQIPETIRVRELY